MRAQSSPGFRRKVTLRIKKNEMEITGQSTLGDACESMGIGYEGEEATVSFNPKFLLDPLRSLQRDKVTLEFRDDMSPGVFKVQKEEAPNNPSFAWSCRLERIETTRKD